MEKNFFGAYEPDSYRLHFSDRSFNSFEKAYENPKASSAGDLFLMKEMSKYDSNRQEEKSIFLSDLKPGNKFLLAGREFEKGETRRTRVLCLEVKSGRKFLIAQLAKVELSE
jgi:hypothetical protein